MKNDILEYNFLYEVALKSYADYLTPIVSDSLKLIVQEAIENMIKYGISVIGYVSETERVITVKHEGKVTYGQQLNAIGSNDLCVFLINTKEKPLLSNNALNLARFYAHTIFNMFQEIDAHGKILRYINNVSQIRARESDKWVNSAPKQWKGDELLIVSKDADNQTASLGQLQQSTPDPFISAGDYLLNQFEMLCPLPSGVGKTDGSAFKRKIEQYREKIEMSMIAFEKKLNGVGFEGFYDFSEIEQQSKSADELLKYAKAQEINNNLGVENDSL